jgi:hypothetical protein
MNPRSCAGTRNWLKVSGMSRMAINLASQNAAGGFTDSAHDLLRKLVDFSIGE